MPDIKKKNSTMKKNESAGDMTTQMGAQNLEIYAPGESQHKKLNDSMLTFEEGKILAYII